MIELAVDNTKKSQSDNVSTGTKMSLPEKMILLDLRSRKAAVDKKIAEVGEMEATEDIKGFLQYAAPLLSSNYDVLSDEFFDEAIAMCDEYNAILY